ASDADGGANAQQNFPLITAAFKDGSSVSVGAILDSAASVSFALLFYASVTCDPSSYGEGETWLGFRPLTTDASGHGFASGTFVTALNAPLFITATATDAAGNTSEFSPCVPVVCPHGACIDSVVPTTTFLGNPDVVRAVGRGGTYD